jgi:hypothetical protein
MQLGGCLSRLISLNFFRESASPGPPQNFQQHLEHIAGPGRASPESYRPWIGVIAIAEK